MSIDAIARELGVTRVVVYHQFDRLESLLLALLDRQEQRAVAALVETIAAGVDLDDPAGSLSRTITALARLVISDAQTWAPIFAPAAATPEVVRARIREDREAIRWRLRDLVAAGSPAHDADLAAHALVALGEYFGRLLLEDPDAVDPDSIGPALVAMVLPRTPAR